mgnify:CR=1 FL=1
MIDIDRYHHAQDVAGAALVQKFTRQAKESGIERAAKNLRKQGFGIGVALACARSIAPAVRSR